MITKNDIITKAHECGFDDIGFTTADPFNEQKQLLESMYNEYESLIKIGIDLEGGTDPQTILPGGKTIIVLMELYYREDYPKEIERYFGRCYLDDDRVTRDGLALRIKSFRSFLRENSIESKVPFNLPHRVAAARAGLGDYGKNCLFYAKNIAFSSSWVLPVAVVIDQDFEPDEPTGGIGCPDWCRNACVAACPTRALKGNGTIDPRKCISYMTYYGNELTPYELREPMGMYVYGCDRCQEVCPRNSPWLAAYRPMNRRVKLKAEYFELTRLLHMDRDYFTTHIWPHMFYMSPDQLWKWKMNVARVMGNSRDGRYASHLFQAFYENTDSRILGMIAWALGQIGSNEGRGMLEKIRNEYTGGDIIVEEEINRALEKK